MATHQSFLKECEFQLSCKIEVNVAILSHLLQHELDGERVSQDKVQKALEHEKQNAFKLAALQNCKQKLLTVAKEQHCQLGVQMQVTSTDSEIEANDQERTEPKTTRASAEVANISQQHAVLLKEAVLILCQAW